MFLADGDLVILIRPKIGVQERESRDCERLRPMQVARNLSKAAMKTTQRVALHFAAVSTNLKAVSKTTKMASKATKVASEATKVVSKATKAVLAATKAICE